MMYLQAYICSLFIKIYIYKCLLINIILIIYVYNYTFVYDYVNILWLYLRFSKELLKIPSILFYCKMFTNDIMY